MRSAKRFVAVACPFVVIAVAVAADDKPGPGDKTGPVTNEQFVMKAANGGMFEVESSKLAKTMAADAKVKAFAEKMIADHTKANEELMKAAKAANVTVPAKLDEKHQKMLDELKNVKGAGFDKAFMVAQEKAHDEAVGLFKSATKSVTDAGLKGFAENTLPTLEEHHKMAKKLRDGTPDK